MGGMVQHKPNREHSPIPCCFERARLEPAEEVQNQAGFSRCGQPSVARGVRIVPLTQVRVRVTLRGEVGPVWSWHPPVGVYIALLAFLGVLVPLFRDLTKIGKGEKAVWTLVMFLLVGLEIKSIYQDRNEHEREQAAARREQLKEFSHIADGLTTAIQNSDRQFSATMEQFGAVLTSTAHIATLTREGVENITGGDSFGFAVPQSFAADTFPLRVWNHGRLGEYWPAR